jgi:hypothetical protein
MHDRNGTPLSPGDRAKLLVPGDYNYETPVVVLKEGPNVDDVVVVVDTDPLHRAALAIGPATVAAFDQMDAAARTTGAPEGTMPVCTESSRLERLDAEES